MISFKVHTELLNKSILEADSDTFYKLLPNKDKALALFKYTSYQYEFSILRPYNGNYSWQDMDRGEASKYQIDWRVLASDSLSDLGVNI